jgi:hypothetical protein
MAGTRNPSTGLQKIGERVAQRVGEPLECLDSRVGPTDLNQGNNLLRQRGPLCEFNLGQARALPAGSCRGSLPQVRPVGCRPATSEATSAIGSLCVSLSLLRGRFPSRVPMEAGHCITGPRLTGVVPVMVR